MSTNNKLTRKMSVVSKAYDLDGDGKLDEAEQAMRDLDTENKGELSKDQIYALMKEHLHTQKSLFRAKSMIVG